MSNKSNQKTFDKQAFIEVLLEHGVLKFGDFILKSGRNSPYFFNAGLLSSSKALSFLAQGYADVLANNEAAVQDLTIFGAAYKGIPFVAATAQALYYHHNINANWGYNRKEVKNHGEGGVLVGADLAGKAVWVIDDVMTAGTAIREVVALLNANGAALAGVIVALDRKEVGSDGQSALAQIEREFATRVYSLISIDDIIDYLKAKGDADILAAMQNYRECYGV